jgi:hypothetical protein
MTLSRHPHRSEADFLRRAHGVRIWQSAYSGNPALRHAGTSFMPRIRLDVHRCAHGIYWDAPLQGEEVRLASGESYIVPPKRPHLVVNGGDSSATFLVLQGIGEYDFVPLT